MQSVPYTVQHARLHVGLPQGLQMGFIRDRESAVQARLPVPVAGFKASEKDVGNLRVELLVHPGSPCCYGNSVGFLHLHAKTNARPHLEVATPARPWLLSSYPTGFSDRTMRRDLTFCKIKPLFRKRRHLQ